MHTTSRGRRPKESVPFRNARSGESYGIIPGCFPVSPSPGGKTSLPESARSGRTGRRAPSLCHERIRPMWWIDFSLALRLTETRQMPFFLGFPEFRRPARLFQSLITSTLFRFASRPVLSPSARNSFSNYGTQNPSPTSWRKPPSFLPHGCHRSLGSS